MKLHILLAIACVSVLATDAVADDFDRRGWYVGMGAGVGADFLSDAVKDLTAGTVDIRPSGSFNLRGGYRTLSWLAFEGMYEGVYGMDINFAGAPLAASTFNSLLFNTKLIVPIWRLQPYLVLGVGAQQGTFNGSGILAALDLSRWDLAIRAGLGLDAYVTKHWLVNFELALSVRFKDYIVPAAATDNVTLTFSAGAQYRF